MSLSIFNSGLEDLLILKCIGIWLLRSVLMLGDCVGERLKLEVVLAIGIANELKSAVSAAKYLKVCSYGKMAA